MKKHLSQSAHQTQKLAKELIKDLISKTQTGPLIILLHGNLGAGKTTFMQGIAKALKIKNKILSPTFVLMKDYKINEKNFKRIFHIDCYRFNSPNEINSLNFKTIIKNPENIVFIEWPERIKKLIPKKSIWIKFLITGKNKRTIIIK